MVNGTRPQNEQYTYPTVTMYRNSIATKKFPTKILLEMIEYSIKNLEEVEYDKQNCLRVQKTLARPTIPILFSYHCLTNHRQCTKNSFLTKKFPIKTLSEMVDSSVKNPGEFEYDKQNRLQVQKTLARPKIPILFSYRCLTNHRHCTKIRF